MGSKLALRKAGAALAVAAVIGSASVAFGTSAMAAPMAVSSAAPAATSDGVDFTTWYNDVTAAVAPAKAYVDQRTAHASGQKLALVFDIDNTTLESYFYPTALPTPAVPQTLDLARFAKSRGVAVFFITARPEALDGLTNWNLQSAGSPEDGLYSRDFLDLFASLDTFKTAARVKVEEKGYTIIANVGNSATDLSGGHAEQTFKLPDYNGQLP